MHKKPHMLEHTLVQAHVWAENCKMRDMQRKSKFSCLQLGFDVDGLATTIPGLAPGAFDPVDPMLLRTPCSAIGLSVAMKLSKEPVARSYTTLWGFATGTTAHEVPRIKSSKVEPQGPLTIRIVND